MTDIEQARKELKSLHNQKKLARQAFVIKRRLYWGKKFYPETPLVLVDEHSRPIPLDMRFTTMF